MIQTPSLPRPAGHGRHARRLHGDVDGSGSSGPTPTAWTPAQTQAIVTGRQGKDSMALLLPDPPTSQHRGERATARPARHRW
jgi:hypothetical protein